MVPIAEVLSAVSCEQGFDTCALLLGDRELRESYSWADSGCVAVVQRCVALSDSDERVLSFEDRPASNRVDAMAVAYTTCTFICWCVHRDQFPTQRSVALLCHSLLLHKASSSSSSTAAGAGTNAGSGASSSVGSSGGGAFGSRGFGSPPPVRNSYTSVSDGKP